MPQGGGLEFAHGRPEILKGCGNSTVSSLCGFVPWNPRESSRLLLEQVQSVLTEYTDYLTADLPTVTIIQTSCGKWRMR